MRGEWLMVGLTGLVAIAALIFRGGNVEAGDQADVEVTIVPRDAEDLGCAGEVSEVACAFDTDWKPRTVASPLRPFVTTAGQMVVVSGVFESSSVKAWVERARGSEVRVKVRCSATIVSPSAPVSLRFRTTDVHGVHRVPVLKADDCSLVVPAGG